MNPGSWRKAEQVRVTAIPMEFDSGTSAGLHASRQSVCPKLTDAPPRVPTRASSFDSIGHVMHRDRTISFSRLASSQVPSNRVGIAKPPALFTPDCCESARSRASCRPRPTTRRNSPGESQPSVCAAPPEQARADRRLLRRRVGVHDSLAAAIGFVRLFGCVQDGRVFGGFSFRNRDALTERSRTAQRGRGCGPP